MNNKNAIVTQIQEALGSECDRDLAERLFVILRDKGAIRYDGLYGLVLGDDIDLVAAASELS